MFKGKKDPKQQQQQEPPKPEGNPEMEKMLKELPGLIQQSVAAGVGQVMQHFNQQQPTKEPVQEPEDPFKDVKFDDLDNQGLFKVIMQGVQQQLEGLQQSIEPKFQEFGTKLQQKELRDEISKVADKKGKEFWAYKEPMRKLANQYPSLSPEDLYDLARSKNPQIAEQLAKEKEEEESQGKPSEKPFGGLTATSGRASETDENMDFDSASQAAWEEVMADVPSDIIGGANH